MIGKNTESDVTSRENQIWHTNILIWYYSDEYIRERIYSHRCSRNKHKCFPVRKLGKMDHIPSGYIASYKKILQFSKGGKTQLNGMLLEIVKNHEYLGTVVSEDGSRNVEINKRILATKSVCNEIVQILKLTELSKVRLQYVNMLSKCMCGQQGKI